MSGADMLAAWLRLPGVDPVHLEPHGIAYRSVTNIGGIRQAKNGRWLIGCWAIPPAPWRVVDDPELIDLVIVDPARPSRFRTWRGVAIMLGEEALHEATWHGLPLPAFRTPMGWLQAAGAGVVPLDLAAFGRATLGYGDLVLVGEDLAHAKQLRNIVQDARRLALPTVKVAA
jgi:hypothetical protein